MSGPSQTLSSTNLCNPPSASRQDTQERSLKVPPSGDFEESEMWKIMMLKLNEQGEKLEKKYDQKFQEQRDEHTQAMEKQKRDLEEKYDQRLQKLSDDHTTAMDKQRSDLEKKLQDQNNMHAEAMQEQKNELEQESEDTIKNLKEHFKTEIEELKSRPYPEHPDILFKQLGGETTVSSFIDSLTEGVEKRLKDKAEALECYQKWVAKAKSKRFNRVTTRVAEGGGVGLAIGGAATAAVHCSLIYGSSAALAKAGVVGLTVGIAAGPAAGIVLGCVGAGCLIVLSAYGIFLLYRKYKKDKALKQPNREYLLDQLAQRFIIEAENKKKVDSMASEIISNLTIDLLHGDAPAET
uniref:uncharacterized protein LOC120342301 n=1 Tax=Styela clava TaxID=7725 RepID=UPI00193AB2F6|nr:uncharacterized protein LOC120342301 [Styela clava]